MGEIIVNNNNRPPCLYGSFVLVFPLHTPISQLSEVLHPNTEYCKYSDCIEATCKVVNNIYSFEINDLLTELFLGLDIQATLKLLSKFNGTALIDISFHHYDVYPALVFEGKNMEIIHSLKANISIDPY